MQWEHSHCRPEDLSEGRVTNVGIYIISPPRKGPPPQPEAHSRRPGNALRQEVRATSCPQAHNPEPGFPPLVQRGHVAFLRWGGGAGRRCPPGPAPSGRGGRGEAPRGGRHAPRGVGVARGAPHEVCFLPPGGWGRASRERGQAGPRGSDVRPRGAFQPRAVRPSVRPGRYAARSPSAPRPLPRRYGPSPRPRGRKSRSGKSVRGAGAELIRGGGARGQLGKFFFSGPEGEVASSWRVRLWVCELGGVCESRPQCAGGGRSGVPHPLAEN